MELIDRLKEVLKEEFNICSDEELLEAVQSMPELDLGGEWLAPAFMLFLEWLIRMMRGVLIDAGIIRGHKKRRRKARVQHDRQEVYRTGAVRREKSGSSR